MSVEEENPPIRRNPGMMGGGAAQEEGEVALDSVTNEADNMLAQARNAGLGYDEGSQVNVSRQSEQKSSQEGSGEDYEEQQESYAEAEAVDDDTHEGETETIIHREPEHREPEPSDQIDGQTIIGAPPKPSDGFTWGVSQGIVATPVTQEIAQMGYGTPEVIIPTAPPAEMPSFPDNITVGEGDSAVTYNLTQTDIPVASYEGVSGEKAWEWQTSLDPEIQSVITELGDVTNQLNEINDPANNGFVKVMLDEPILVSPEVEEVRDSYGNIITPASLAVYQDFSWIHETVQDANRDLEQHQLTNPTIHENLPEGWTIVDEINLETGEKIQSAWDHDDNPDTPDVFRWADLDETIPVWQQKMQPPEVVMKRLDEEMAELAGVETVYNNTVENFDLEIKGLNILETRVRFWNDGFVNDDGRFTGTEEQYKNYKLDIEKYENKLVDVKNIQSTIQAGYNPIIPKLDDVGEPILDADGNIVTISDLDNPLRGLIFQQVEEGEGKYIKTKTGNFVKSPGGDFNIKMGTGGLPFENLWTSYFGEFNDVNNINRELNRTSNNIVALANAWSLKHATLVDAQQTHVFTHHGLDSKGQPANENSTWNLLFNDKLPEAQDSIQAQDDLFMRFEELKGSLMEGNEQLANQLAAWNTDTSGQYRDAVAWRTLQWIEDEKEHRQLSGLNLPIVESMPGSYGGARGEEDSFWVTTERTNPKTGELEEISQWVTPGAYAPSKEIRGDFYHGDTDISGRPINVALALTPENWQTYFINTNQWKYELIDGTKIQATNLKPTEEELADPDFSPISIVREIEFDETGTPISQVIIKPPQMSGVTWSYGDSYSKGTPEWAIEPTTGKPRTGYKRGMSPEVYAEHLLHLTSGGAAAFANLTSEEVSEHQALIQTNTTLEELQPAIDFFSNNSYILGIGGTKDMKIFEPGEEGSRYTWFMIGGTTPGMTPEMGGLMIGYNPTEEKPMGTEGIYDNETGRFIPKYLPRPGLDKGEFTNWIRGRFVRTINPEWDVIDLGRRIYNANKSTVIEIFQRQNADRLDMPTRLALSAHSGLVGNVENITRINPNYRTPLDMLQGEYPRRWGTGEIADFFEGFGGAVIGRTAPNVHSLTTLGGRLPNWAGRDPEGTRVEFTDPSEAGIMFRRPPDGFLSDSAVLGVFAEAPDSPKISFVEMTGINYYPNTTQLERQALMSAYVGGSLVAETVIDAAVLGALTIIGRGFLRGGKKGAAVGFAAGVAQPFVRRQVMNLIQSRAAKGTGKVASGFQAFVFKSAPAQKIITAIPDPIESFIRASGRTAAQGPRVVAEIGHRAITETGTYAPLGSVYRFIREPEGLARFSGVAIGKGAAAIPNRAFGTKWLSDIDILPSMTRYTIKDGIRQSRKSNIIDWGLEALRPGTKMDPRTVQRVIPEADVDNFIKNTFGPEYSRTNLPPNDIFKQTINEINPNKVDIIYQKPGKAPLNKVEQAGHQALKERIDNTVGAFRRGHDPFATRSWKGEIFETKYYDAGTTKGQTYRGDYMGNIDYDPIGRWLLRRTDFFRKRSFDDLDNMFGDFFGGQQYRRSGDGSFGGGYARSSGAGGGAGGRRGYERTVYENLKKGPISRTRREILNDIRKYHPDTVARRTRISGTKLTELEKIKNIAKTKQLLEELSQGNKRGFKIPKDFKKTQRSKDAEFHADDIKNRTDIREVQQKIDATDSLLEGRTNKYGDNLLDSKKLEKKKLLDDFNKLGDDLLLEGNVRKLLDDYDFKGRKLLDDLKGRKLLDDFRGKKLKPDDLRLPRKGRKLLDEGPEPKKPKKKLEGPEPKRRLPGPEGRKLLDEGPEPRKPKLEEPERPRIEGPRKPRPDFIEPRKHLPEDIKKIEPDAPTGKMFDDFHLRKAEWDIPRWRPKLRRLLIPAALLTGYLFGGKGGRIGGRGRGGATSGMYGGILIRPITNLKIFSTDTTAFLPQLKKKVKRKIKGKTPSTPKPVVTIATEIHNPLIQEPMDYVDTRNPTIIPNKIAPQQAPFGQAYMPKESLGEMKFPEQPTQELPPNPEHVTNNDMSVKESWQVAFGRPGEDQLGMQINAGTDVFPTINPNNMSSKSITNFMTTNTPKQNVNKPSLKNIMKGDFF